MNHSERGFKNEPVEGFVGQLQDVLAAFPDYRFLPAPGATSEAIVSLERAVGVSFDATLKSLWMFSNGSDRVPWFGVRSDEDTACTFLSIEDALKSWREWNRLGEKWGGMGMPDNCKRDPRIQRDWSSPWFPFGEFNGGSTMILFDSVPAPGGSYGQIVVYQHDPDGLYYIAENTAEFLRQSSGILRRCLQELADIE